MIRRSRERGKKRRWGEKRGVMGNYNEEKYNTVRKDWKCTRKKGKGKWGWEIMMWKSTVEGEAIGNVR